MVIKYSANNVNFLTYHLISHPYYTFEITTNREAYALFVHFLKKYTQNILKTYFYGPSLFSSSWIKQRPPIIISPNFEIILIAAYYHIICNWLSTLHA